MTVKIREIETLKDSSFFFCVCVCGGGVGTGRDRHIVAVFIYFTYALFQGSTSVDICSLLSPNTNYPRTIVLYMETVPTRGFYADVMSFMRNKV